MLSREDLIRRGGSLLARLRQDVVPGSAIGHSVDIHRLMCPLRYDLLVRIRLVHLLSEEWQLYRSDLNAFLDRAPVRAYRVWFRDVCCARYRPDLCRDPKRLADAFIGRVHETAALWRSIVQHGFDTSKPIRLMTGRSIRSVNGKRVKAKYFAGDGCHRIACLYVAGRTTLAPAHYEVVIYPTFEPLDNTAILAERLPLHRTTYLRFVSRFYCDGEPLDSVEEIKRQVAARKPALLPELESVLAYDLSRVRAYD